jgi:hypothetical protein
VTATAFRRTHPRAGATTMALWLSMATAIAACASAEDARPPAIGDCNGSGDASCSASPALGPGAGDPSNGGLNSGGGEAGSSASGTGGADGGAASRGNGAGVMPIADAASAPQTGD